MIHGYLEVTEDQYPVVRLTESSRRILDGERILMKVAKERPKAEKEKKEKRAGFSREDMDRGLFERLRTLRMEIAREEKVPPYIVFSDKTLVQMCMLKPHTREDMLQVSGVGEMKYQKYGERFLAVLTED